MVALSLVIPVATSVASAATPTCDGKPATIVGSNKRNVINGTSGRDVIVARGGNDRIDGKGGRDRICGGTGHDAIQGRSGNDRIFGGSGNDLLEGGTGHDDLFGFTGSDVLHGNAGNDLLNGGAAADECDQGAGVGPVIACEVADLSIDVRGPDSAPEGVVTFTVEVTNDGPDAVAYVIETSQSNMHAQCDSLFDSSIEQAALAAGTSRSIDLGVDCVVEGDDPVVTVHASVVSAAGDPDLGDASDEWTIQITS
jgi:Ca2+-binding RTX toxin-like protein